MITLRDLLPRSSLNTKNIGNDAAKHAFVTVSHPLHANVKEEVICKQVIFTMLPSILLWIVLATIRIPSLIGWYGT